MNDAEEISVRLLVGDMEASKEIQAELNTILQHIPPCERVQRETITTTDV